MLGTYSVNPLEGGGDRNNLGGLDGWVGPDAIYGRVVLIGADPDIDGLTVVED